MTLDDVKKEIATLRASYDPHAADEGHVRVRLGLLTDLVRDVEQRDREVAAPALDVRGVSTRNKRLQAADTALGPCARAEFRTRHEPETDAIDRRVAQLNAPAGSSAPGADEKAVARERARATYRALRQTNPIAASAFAARAGDSLLFDETPSGDAA